MRDNSDKILIWVLIVLGFSISALGLLSILSSSELASWLLFISGVAFVAFALLLALLPESLPGLYKVVGIKQARIARDIRETTETLEQIESETHGIREILNETRNVE